MPTPLANLSRATSVSDSPLPMEPCEVPDTVYFPKTCPLAVKDTRRRSWLPAKTPSSPALVLTLHALSIGVTIDPEDVAGGAGLQHSNGVDRGKADRKVRG